MQMLGLAVGFVLIVVLVIRRYQLALAMVAGTLVVGLTAGLGLQWLGRTWWGGVIHPDTLELAAMVGSITLLSNVMAVSGLHERLVNATIGLLRSAKLAVMFIPPLIGSLPIPGGAIVSAPLVDKPGNLLGLTQARKAAVNLVFRHANFFLLPFSSSVILASKLINADIYTLLKYLAPLGLVVWVSGYFTLIRSVKEVPLGPDLARGRGASEVAAAMDPGRTHGRGRDAREFLVSGSPILVALGLGFLFGIPLWVAVLCGTVLALALTWKAHKWSASGLVRSVDFKLMGAMFAIMGFRAVVVGGGTLGQVAAAFQGSGIPIPVVAFTMAMMVSTVSANHNTTLGIVYPMILSIIAPAEVMAYAMLIFAGSFVAYFASPLHLCQILTNEYCKVGLPQVFREYVWVLVAIAVASWGLFVVYLP